MPRLPIDTVLLIVDVQVAADDPKWGPLNNPDGVSRIADLLAAWRAAKMPIVHIRHDSTQSDSPYRPGTLGHAFKPEVSPQPGEAIVGKQVNSAFIAPDLDAWLTERGATTLAVCGVHTQHCVETTVRHAGNLGYRVFVAADACRAAEVRDLTGRVWPAEDVHQLSLAVLQGEFATVTDTAALMSAAGLARAIRDRFGR
jgi:nicotinamidase-related amidase